MKETFEFERDGRKFVVEAHMFFDEWIGENKVTCDVFEQVIPGLMRFRGHADCTDGPLQERAVEVLDAYLIDARKPFEPALTFESLLDLVRGRKRLHRVIFDYSVTFLRESYSDDVYAFGWVVKHPCKGFEDESRRIVLTCGELLGDRLQMVEATPEQLLQFREALCLKVEFDEEEED